VISCEPSFVPIVTDKTDSLSKHQSQVTSRNFNTRFENSQRMYMFSSYQKRCWCHLAVIRVPGKVKESLGELARGLFSKGGEHWFANPMCRVKGAAVLFSARTVLEVWRYDRRPARNS
jgi:hypothetical protein